MRSGRRPRLGRRTFLRGVVAGTAVALALPWLEGMDHTAWAGPDPAVPRRFGVWFFGNGVRRAQWIPRGQGRTWVTSAELAPLEGLRSYVNVLTGFENKVQPYHPHHSGMCGIMTGDSFHQLSAGRAGIVTTFAHKSIDQVAADTLAGKTPFRSLELGVCQFRGSAEGTTFEHLSHNGPSNPNPAEYSPARLFARLFGSVATVPGSAVRKSVLDAVLQQAAALKNQVSLHDQVRLDQHLSSIREIERRLVLPVSLCTAPARPFDVPNVDGKEPIEQKNQLMADLLAVALSCDLTRVFSLLFSTCGSRVIVWEAGATDSLHYLCHTELVPQPLVHKATVFTMAQFAYFLKRLRDTPEGGGNLLDSCAILCTSEHSEGNTHTVDEFPLVIAGRAGGALQGGIHYRSPSKENTSRALLTVLRAAGCPLTGFGYDQGYADSTVAAIES